MVGALNSDEHEEGQESRFDRGGRVKIYLAPCQMHRRPRRWYRQGRAGYVNSYLVSLSPEFRLGMFEHYTTLHRNDTTLRRFEAANEWLSNYDLMSSSVRYEQEFGLLQYLSYSIAPLHHHLATSGIVSQRVDRPTAYWDVSFLYLIFSYPLVIRVLLQVFQCSEVRRRSLRFPEAFRLEDSGRKRCQYFGISSPTRSRYSPNGICTTAEQNHITTNSSSELKPPPLYPNCIAEMTFIGQQASDQGGRT